MCQHNRGPKTPPKRIPPKKIPPPPPKKNPPKKIQPMENLTHWKFHPLENYQRLSYVLFIWFLFFVFVNTGVSGCLFHSGQSCCCEICELGKKVQYNTGSLFALRVKYFSAVAFFIPFWCCWRIWTSFWWWRYIFPHVKVRG